MNKYRDLKFYLGEEFRPRWKNVGSIWYEPIERDYYGRKTIIELDGKGDFRLDFYNFTKKDEIELILRGEVKIVLTGCIRLWVTDYREKSIKRFDCIKFERKFTQFERKFTRNIKLHSDVDLIELNKGDRVLLSNRRLFMNEEEELISEIIE